MEDSTSETKGWTHATVLSTSLGKTIFAWRFIWNENILFRLTISYQKPFVFSISVFCSQISTQKLNLRPKIGLTYAIFIVKDFLNFLSKKIFFTVLCWISITDVSQQFCKNVKKMKRNLLKMCLQITCPTDFCIICIILLWEKVKIFDFLKTND